MTELTNRAVAEVSPFLKWAGGKRWFASNHMGLIPAFSGRYFEVFLGSGALFFSLSPKKATLNDINIELVNAYIVVRDNREAVEGLLAEYQKRHSDKFYYSVRGSQPTCTVTRAARFIYLNRTCWNGLYRVNLDGQFNVPIGTKSEVTFPSGALESISLRLRSAKLCCLDFETVVDQAKEGDFVFADPPYTVNHNLNGFLKYNEKLFSWEDQRRLHAAAVRAAKRGVKIAITNADHSSIRELYKGKNFSQLSIPRHSKLSGSSAGRKAITELIIRG